MTFNVLLTCAGDEFAPQVIHYLNESKRHDVRVIGVDVNSDASGRHFADAFAVVPPGDAPNYVDVIAEIAERHAVDLIIPKADEEALALAARRSEIETGGRLIACGDLNTLETVSNKMAAYEHLARNGISVPEWVAGHSLDEITGAVDDMIGRFGDIVVKPAASRGGRDVYVIRGDRKGAATRDGTRETHLDRDTFLSDYLGIFARNLPALVMQRLVEPVYDIDLLAWKGDALRLVPRRRLDSARPNEGHLFIEAPALIELGRALARALNLTWLYDIDVMLDGNGNPGILEINPRPSGSLSATVASGVPLLDDLISLAKGETIPDLPPLSERLVVPFRSVALSETR